MAHYKTSNINNIFWAMNDGFKAGRDPMGVQNSSIATYSCLLPGMTNLTGHIRYYSIYCWLLDEFDKLDKQGHIELHQYNFIRRAEYIMAFIMKNEEVNSVVGSNFIAHKNHTILADGAYDIAAGADYEQKDKYWSFKTGAFGQYYLGSLIHYKLVKIEEGRFYLRDKGKEMAKAVSVSIDQNAQNLFLKSIISGKLYESDIPALLSIGLHKIKADSNEWKCLNMLLIEKDIDGSTLRRDSVFLMLSDLSRGIKREGFVENRFLHRIDSNEAAFGWYFYFLCEALHYGIESILCHVLNSIDSLYRSLSQYPPIEILLEKATETVYAEWEKDNGNGESIKTVKEYLELTDNSIVDVFSNVKLAIRHQEYANAMNKSMLLFTCLYKEFQDNKDQIVSFEKKYDLRRQRGIFSSGLKDYLGRYIETGIKDYISSLIRQVMNEHTIVAVAKMENSNVDLRKFIIEDGRVILVEIRYPNQTSPRITSLYNFLIDLGYISKDNRLTSIANTFMNQYGEE